MGERTVALCFCSSIAGSDSDIPPILFGEVCLTFVPVGILEIIALTCSLLKNGTNIRESNSWYQVPELIPISDYGDICLIPE
jgi:hypothetical protein